MTRIEKIEQEIPALSAEERSALRAWFPTYDSDLWDNQIEADAIAGKVDDLADEALAEHRDGMTKLP